MDQQLELAGFYRRVRQKTEALCKPLCIEDFGLQSMPDASPSKWHLAHTTWFFETLVLEKSLAGYQSFARASGFYSTVTTTLSGHNGRVARGL